MVEDIIDLIHLVAAMMLISDLRHNENASDEASTKPNLAEQVAFRGRDRMVNRGRNRGRGTNVALLEK